MTAPLNNSQFKMLAAETMSFRAPLLVPEQPSLAQRLRAFVSEMLIAGKRRSVVNELNTLTDRELADIGLNRSELGRVFDPQFVRDRHYA